MRIVLTSEEIFEMARFAGAIVDEPKKDKDGLETEYIYDDEMEIIDTDDFTKYKGSAIFISEYPDEGALPLLQSPENFIPLTEEEIKQLRVTK